jgi:transcriptional regulator with XRE-family HTH domain
MLSLIRRSTPEKAEPGAIRATREAFGWSQERLAEEMGVMPLEVAAWESGAIAVDAYQAEMMRWRMEHAEYLARLPRSECYWTRANADRLERMKETPWRSTQLRATREIDAHTRECTECMRVQAMLQEVPPPPAKPVPPGFNGWLEGVSRGTPWLRPPLKLASYLLATAVGAIALTLFFYAVDVADWLDLSVETFALIYAGVHWFVFLMRRLERLTLDHPYAAGMATALGVAIPANVVLGMLGHTELSSVAAWAQVLLMVLVIGWLLGAIGSKDEEESDEPPATAELPPEERVVHIRQQDTSWRL